MPGLTNKTAEPPGPRVRNATDGLVKFDLREPVSSLDWSPDGKNLVVAGTEGSLAIVDAASGNVTRQLSGHKGVMRTAWSPNGLWIASGGQDGKIKLWHFQSGELYKELEGGAAWVEHVAWSPDGGVLASAAGKYLRLWTFTGDMTFEFASHESTITALQFRGDGKGLATACYGKVRCFRFGADRPYQTLAWKASLISMGWSPNARFIATGTQENSIQFFRLQSRGEPPLKMSGYPSKVKHLAWDRTAQYLATNSRDVAIVWNVSGQGPEGTIPLQLAAHPAAITALAYQKRGDLLASGCEAGVVIIWNPSQCPWPSRKPTPTDKHVSAVRLSSSINQLRWSPDESALAIGCQGGTIAIMRAGSLNL